MYHTNFTSHTTRRTNSLIQSVKTTVSKELVLTDGGTRFVLDLVDPILVALYIKLIGAEMLNTIVKRLASTVDCKRTVPSLKDLAALTEQVLLEELVKFSGELEEPVEAVVVEPVTTLPFNSQRVLSDVVEGLQSVSSNLMSLVGMMNAHNTRVKGITA
ncbi:MAG: hypothetical protein WA173_14235 [Pseudomonas sp.]|uniref:hypothetical protein n=1 Tax=Pseudomonas sp. TaxID=306 RepID=UPI003BB736A6